MRSGAGTAHKSKLAQARLKTNRFTGASGNPTVREIDRIRTRFCRNPANPKSTRKTIRPAVSASVRYALNVEVISSDSRGWLKFEMFVKFILLSLFLDFL
jgi:hypothetical protein